MFPSSHQDHAITEMYIDSGLHQPITYAIGHHSSDDDANKSSASALVQNINLVLPWDNWRNGFFLLQLIIIEVEPNVWMQPSFGEASIKAG